MTAFRFDKLDQQTQIAYLKRQGKLLDTLVRGNFLICLYWTKNLVFEVFILRNNGKIFDIKTYDRNKYAA